MRTRSKLALLLVPIAATGLLAVDAYVWAVEVGAVLVAVLAVDALDGRRLGGWQVGPHRRAVHALLWVYVALMLVGATWTYGGAPPGLWLQEAFGLARNPWDRIGHLFQGALPALVVLGLRRAAGPTTDGAAPPSLAGGTGEGATVAVAGGQPPNARPTRSHEMGTVAAQALDAERPSRHANGFDPAPRDGYRRLRTLGLGLAAGLAIAGLFEGLEAAFAHFAPAGVDFVDAQGDAHDRAWDLGLAVLGAVAAVAAVRPTRPAVREPGVMPSKSAQDPGQVEEAPHP